MTTTIVRMQQASRGSHFRAVRLHGANPEQLDPFMGIDHAWMSAPTFPAHPHAGFSAVTYLFPDSETQIANRDSLGNDVMIQPGGLHWTAAGRGVVHQEDPAVTGRSTHLLQIFVNLPQHKQHDAPYALTLAPQDVPVFQQAGVRVRIPLGHYQGLHSPLTPPTEVTLLDVTLEAGACFTLPRAAGQRAFFMPISGGAELDGQRFGAADLGVPILAPDTAASRHQLVASADGAQIAVFIGQPLHQAIFSNGPMAFTTAESLNAAALAYHRGEMGNLPASPTNL